MSIEELLTESLENQIRRTYVRLGTIAGIDRMHIVIELRRWNGEVSRFLVDDDRITPYTEVEDDA